MLNLGNNEASSPLALELPREERELLHQALKEALQPGYRLSELMPQEMRAQVRESIQALKDTRAQSEEAHPLTIRHVLTDHLGTPLALVNANGPQAGQVAWAARYTAWGQIEEEYNPNRIHQPIRLQGQQLDPETNLHYNRFRYYDPRVGQYVTPDPIGLRGGINVHIYTNMPVSHIDPLGLSGNAHQRSVAKGIKDKQVAIDNKTKGALDSSGKQKASDFSDWLSDLMNGITGKNDQTKRTDEALICKKQEHKGTKETTEPGDVIAPNSAGVGIIRKPSPSEIGGDYSCIEVIIRPMPNAPLQGLEAPGRP